MNFSFHGLKGGGSPARSACALEAVAVRDVIVSVYPVPPAFPNGVLGQTATNGKCTGKYPRQHHEPVPRVIVL